MITNTNMMVKKITLVVCVLIASVSALAQNIVNIALPPDAAAFFDNHGPYIVKETYDTKKPEIKVVILHDYFTGECIGYVTYKSKDPAENAAKVLFGNGNLSYYTSSLDYEELQYVIECWRIGKEEIIGQIYDSNEFDFSYTTRMGGHIGLKCKPNKYSANYSWLLYFNADPMCNEEFERAMGLNYSYETYMKIFVDAKRLIEEKMGIDSPLSLSPNGDN